MADESLRQLGDADHHIGRGHQLADEEEEGNRHQRFGIDAVEHLPDDRLQRDRREQASDHHARREREGDRHAEIAEHQEEHRHHNEDEAVRHGYTASCNRFSAATPPSVKPLRKPLTICSRLKRAMSPPQTGMGA